MKKHVVILAVSLLLLGTISIFAQETNSNGNLPLSQEAIDNYLVGMQSDNLGLRVSCAYFLGEYKASEAIIPLMKMLHSDKSDAARIVAALSLTKIGSDKSVFAVKQAARFDESERVRNLCAKFYNSYTYLEKNQSEQF
jgi:HEAT repeat protein